MPTELASNKSVHEVVPPFIFALTFFANNVTVYCGDGGASIALSGDAGIVMDAVVGTAQSKHEDR